MKKILLGAAALMTIAAVPCVAAADTTAEVGVGFGNIDVDGVGDFDITRIDGAFSHTTDGGLTLQVDGAHDRQDAGGTDLGNSYGAINLGHRSGSHAIYGFVGLADQVALSGTMFGVGGQLYLGNFTFNGSAGWSDFDTFEVQNLSVDGVYFFTPNFGVGGEASWAEVDGPDTDFTTLGVNAVWRFGGSPFSIGGGYQWVDIDGGGDVDVWRIRLAYNIGTGSEHERSQNGASWDGARRLHEASYGIFF